MKDKQTRYTPEQEQAILTVYDGLLEAATAITKWADRMTAKLNAIIAARDAINKAKQGGSTQCN